MAKKSEKWRKLKARSWYLQQNGEEVGPLTETALRQMIQQGGVDDQAEARQGDSKYFPIADIKDMFAALNEGGWYVLEDGNTFGPYLAERLEALMASGFFAQDRALVRCGQVGDWATWRDATRSSRKNVRDRRAGDDVDAASMAGGAVSIATIDEPGDAIDDAIDGATDGAIDGASSTATAADSPQSSEPTEAESRYVTCEKCGRRYARRKGECKRCARAEEKERKQKLDVLGRRRDALSGSSDNEIGDRVILCFAMGAIGYFLSKWLISSVLWTEYYTSGEQSWGWICLCIAAVLTVTGLFVIFSDPDRRTDVKIWVGGVASLLIVGFIVYLTQHGRLSEAQQQIEQQDTVWAEVMLDGGYKKYQD